ncbi:MAG: N-acetyltransferase, partial [bacterium]|nr:N-acetyltransferase [bacterium]
MEILTERLRLRDFKPEDLDAFYCYQNDPRYLEHYPYSEISRTKIQNLMEKFIVWSEDQPRFK